jgi:hypothetical protein
MRLVIISLQMSPACMCVCHGMTETSAPAGRERLALPRTTGLFVWLISHQSAVFFSQNKPVMSNQPTILFSLNKSASAINNQPNEQAVYYPTLLRSLVTSRRRL